MTMATPQPQQGAKPESNPVTVPVDTSQPLKPTHALSITHTKHHTIIIHDLTPSLPSLFSHKNGINLEEATNLIDATPAPPTLFTLTKENLLCTHLTAHDKEGKEVAEWKNPILSLHASKVTIKFLGENEEKIVEVNPIGYDRVSEVCAFFPPAGCFDSVSLRCLHFLEFSSSHSAIEGLFPHWFFVMILTIFHVGFFLFST